MSISMSGDVRRLDDPGAAKIAGKKNSAVLPECLRGRVGVVWASRWVPDTIEAMRLRT